MKRAVKSLSIEIIVLFVVISMLSNVMLGGNALGVQSSINPSSTNIQSFDSELDSVDSSQVSVHTQGCCEGYTLINSIWTELIDMNGKLIHRWRTFAPMPAKMLPGGSIIVGDKYKFFGYACGDFKTLEELDWNGSVTWSYNGWENGRARQHHDFQLEGNPVGYYTPGQEFIPREKH